MASETSFSDLKRRRQEESVADRWARWLLNLVDVALAGCIFAVPMLLGGRSAAGHFGLTVLAVIAASVWWIRQTLLPRQYWRRSAGNVLLLAAIALVVMQIVPLPASWTSQLAPKATEILPLWSGADNAAGFDAWRQISLAPGASRNGLVLLLAYSLVFWVTVQRIRSMEDVERLLRWIAFATIGMAVFGLLQYFTSNGKFFWVYQHPFSDTSDGTKGAFTNRNHFAHFLALGIGPLIWWVQDGLRRHGMQSAPNFQHGGMRHQAANLDMGLRLAGLVVVLLAVLMSLSRGGAIAAGLAALLSVAVCYRARVVRGRFALGLTAIALLFGGFLLVGDQDSLGGRLEGMASGSIDQIDNGQGRRMIWKTTLAAIPDFRWVGSGTGSFGEVYPLYMEQRDGHTIYTHAENGYLQVTLETGLVGLSLVVLAILVGSFWAGRGLLRAATTRAFLAAGAIAAGMLVSVVHSGVDFVWYAPGCLVPALILTAAACRIHQFTHDEQRRSRDRFVLPRTVAWLAASMVIAMGFWMVSTQVGPLGAERHWAQYRLLSRAMYLNPPSVKLPEKKGFSPEDPGVAAVREEAARQQTMAEELDQEQHMMAELVEAIRWDPNHAEAHLALAGGYMRLFHFAQDKAINRMPLSQIRDAAMAAKYSSREELNQWLKVAVGDHYRYLNLALHHTKAALTLCPLQGEGYLYLGELCFLEGAQASNTWDFVDQALRVRPHDGSVLFHAGREAWLAGRIDEGLGYWRKSFDAGAIYQRQVIDWMAGRTVASALGYEIEFIIDQFKPNLEVLMYMQSRYKPIAEPPQLTPLLEAIAGAAQSQAQVDLEEGRPELAAERWLDAMSAYKGMLRWADAAAAGKQAVQCNPHSFDARYRLGSLLADMRQFADADVHLSWCNVAKPGHIPVKRRLKEVKHMLLDPERRDMQRFGNFYPPGTDFMETSLQVPGRSGPNEPRVRSDANGSQTNSQGYYDMGSGSHQGSSYTDPKSPTPAGRGVPPASIYRR